MDNLIHFKLGALTVTQMIIIIIIYLLLLLNDKIILGTIINTVGYT